MKGLHEYVVIRDELGERRGRYRGGRRPPLRKRH